MDRVFNFSPGPSMLALPVLEKAQKDMMCYGATGMSVMEMSHRSKMYTDIYDKTVADLRKLMNIPDDYDILFLQGGATEQFSGIPLNLMVNGKADYVDSGNFAHLAAEEAKRCLYFKGECEKLLDEAKEALPVKTKLLKSAGVMCGILAAVLLI